MHGPKDPFAICGPGSPKRDPHQSRAGKHPMQVLSANSAQYPVWQPSAPSGPADLDSGRDVQPQPANLALSTASQANTAVGSTPSSQFSQDLLSQLIQTQISQDQTDQSGAQSTGSQSQQAAAQPPQQSPAVGHAHHGHHHHGASAAQANTDGVAAVATETTPTSGDPSAGENQTLAPGREPVIASTPVGS